MMKFVLKNAHKSGTRFGVLFKPSTIGDPIAIDIAHTNSIVTNIRVLFLCFAYLIGCVTAIYLKKRNQNGKHEKFILNYLKSNILFYRLYK